jgi:hypothetical protein
MPKLPLFALPLLLATPATAQSVPSYDQDWYKADFWSGEYPNGFTVLEDTTLMLRPAPSAPEKTIEWPLPAKATIHPWNVERSKAMGLEFVTFWEIQLWEVKTDYEAVLYDENNLAEATVKFTAGNHWKYLAYYAEGTFLMDYAGVRYTGDQGLIEVSTPVNPADRSDEWLRINCPNNMWGWLYFPDLVIDDKTIGGPNVVEYGRSADLE